MPDHYIVDGTNFCYSNSAPTVTPLLNLLTALAERNDTFFCVFDASTKHRLRERGQPNDVAAYEQLVTLFPNLFGETTGGITADEFVLTMADKLGCKVISCDRYRDHEARYPWLTTDNSRLIKGQAMGGSFVVPRLGLLTPIVDDSQALDNLKRLLPTPPKPKRAPRIPRPPVASSKAGTSDGKREAVKVKPAKKQDVRRPSGVSKSRLVVTLEGDNGFRRVYYEDFVLDRNELRGVLPKSITATMSGSGMLFTLGVDHVEVTLLTSLLPVSLSNQLLHPDIRKTLPQGKHTMTLGDIQLLVSIDAL